MSGGVGPVSDIKLPEEHPAAEITNKKKLPSIHYLFTLKQLNVLAIAIVLSASGMVSIEDFAFVVFSIIYMYLFSKIVFPPTSSSSSSVFDGKSKIYMVYSAIGAIIGLFLPIAYIFQGILEEDKEGIKAATPHLFLLAGQILMEGLFSGNFSPPVRVFVPVFYNARRVLTIMEWVTNEFYKEEHVKNEKRLFVGRALAVGNMAFWSFNLFGVLLPFLLPKAFKAYYGKVKD